MPDHYTARDPAQSALAPNAVCAFYERIWNNGELAAISELVTPHFRFRGSLGLEMCGREPFTEYVLTVRRALSDYKCEILDCVSEKQKAFVKMRFSGTHTGPFRGFPPTGKFVHWLAAALFVLEGELVAETWVLGDLVGLDAALRANSLTSGPG